jgi:uncharacterized membrane protein
LAVGGAAARQDRQLARLLLPQLGQQCCAWLVEGLFGVVVLFFFFFFFFCVFITFFYVVVLLLLRRRRRRRSESWTDAALVSSFFFVAKALHFFRPSPFCLGRKTGNQFRETEKERE